MSLCMCPPSSGHLPDVSEVKRDHDMGVHGVSYSQPAVSYVLLERERSVWLWWEHHISQPEEIYEVRGWIKDLVEAWPTDALLINSRNRTGEYRRVPFLASSHFSALSIGINKQGKTWGVLVTPWAKMHAMYVQCSEFESSMSFDLCLSQLYIVKQIFKKNSLGVRQGPHHVV